MSERPPAWQSTVVAAALLAAVVAGFLVLFLAADVDGALKAYSAVGALVGMAAGVLATSFFTWESVRQERALRTRAELQLQVLVAAAGVEALRRAGELRPDLFGHGQDRQAGGVP
jgi:hypothetical protein